MPGPKYVDNFEFPSSFGFTGSASDSPFTQVRGYQRARRRFQQGGRVESEEDRKARLAAERLEAIRKAKREGTLGSSKKPSPKKEGESSGSVRARTTDPISALRGTTRREQEDALGLAKGGKVKPKPKKAMGGPVKAAKGGKCGPEVKKAMAAHIRAPRPRGHGVKK